MAVDTMYGRNAPGPLLPCTKKGARHSLAGETRYLP